MPDPIIEYFIVIARRLNKYLKEQKGITVKWQGKEEEENMGY